MSRDLLYGPLKKALEEAEQAEREKWASVIERKNRKLEEILEIAQFDTKVPEWQRLQNIAATAASGLEDPDHGEELLRGQGG